MNWGAKSVGLALLAALVLPSAGGCTLHRNLLLRWHMEFDADNVPDACVPGCVDDGRCCRTPSKLGNANTAEGAPPVTQTGCRACMARHARAEMTPAQLGHARFHPLPVKPVFPAPNNEDMADEGPPAPKWYLQELERQQDPRYRGAEELGPPPPESLQESRRLKQPK